MRSFWLAYRDIPLHLLWMICVLHQRARLARLTVGYLSSRCVQKVLCLMRQSVGNRFLSSLRYSVAHPVMHFNQGKKKNFRSRCFRQLICSEI